MAKKLFLLIAFLFLTGCQTAGQIKAEGVKYRAMTESDIYEQSSQVKINATATAVTLAAEIDQETKQDSINANRDFIWYKSITVNGIMIIGGIIILLSIGAFSFYYIRIIRASAIEAENKAKKYVTFALDKSTGSYPLIGVGDMLLLPVYGSNMSTTKEHEPNKMMIAGATQIQASRLIAENAAKSATQGNGSGVAQTNPFILYSGENNESD